MLQKMSVLMGFRAPYLEQRLLRLGVAHSADESLALFQELKKYFVLSALDARRIVPMFSTRIDEAWHQFALFTREYQYFCSEFAGKFIHHQPVEAPWGEPDRPVLEFSEFRAAYEALFGELADVWFDERWLTPATRVVLAPWAQPLRVRVEERRALLVQVVEPEAVLCRVNSRAADALSFIARARCFFVRELPGLKGDGERLVLCRSLVQSNILRVKP